jgi:hypothetical protein
VKAWVYILLGIGFTLVPTSAGTAARGEAAQFLGVGSPYDTSRVFPRGGYSHGFPRWERRRDRGAVFQYPARFRQVEDQASPRAESWPEAVPPIDPVIDQGLYGADGNVLAMARAANTLYIAGAFRSVGENRGGCVSFDTRSGEVLPSFPKVAGSVYAIVSDGAGGWYIGGDFTGVGGKPRSCLAQIGADGSVSDWAPAVTGSPGYVAPPVVLALAVHGSRVFIGGDFRFIGGQPRMDVGCVSTTTGAVLDWVADTPEDGYVRALALQGDTLFVGGGFSSLGGASRSSLAAVSALTGEVLPWRMDVFGGAYALLACADTLYVGGDFLAIAGQPQPILVAVDVPSATLLPIDFKARGINQDYVPAPQVAALSKVGDTLFAVGNFTQIGGQVRSGIAALNATTGGALAWSPDTTGPRGAFPPLLCLSVAVSGGAVYIGGFFTLVGDAYHPFVAAWDQQTGRVRDWTPRPDYAVYALATQGDTLYAGGEFHMMGEWRHRAGLAAIDLATGRVKPWNPNPNGSVCTALAVKDARVFVSGDFSIVGGDPQPHSYFAALDTINGEASGWDPGANDLASVFLVAGDTLYAAGYFTQIGGQSRNFVGAVSSSTGELLPWDPNADNWVLALARTGDDIVLGGLFGLVGNQPRTGIAKVDGGTGILSAWNPGTDNRTVKTLLVAGNTVYVGGAFGAIGDQPRNAIAAVDVATGMVRPWYPPPTEWGVPTEVKALALHDSTLYVGGAFGTLNGQPRICLAGVDTSTALTTSWDPGLDGYVWSLLTSETALYVGGGFSRAAGIPADDLAAFAFAPAPPPAPPPFALSQCSPNPARTSAQIRFGIPRPLPVTLSIYDIQGRRVTVPLDRVELSAGEHVVQVSTQTWRSGVYFCRLEAGGEVAGRKMLVVR